MILKVQHVDSADFELMTAYTNTETGDLVAPGIASSWPSPSSERTQFSSQRELDMFHNDPSVHFMKVINDEGEILSLGRWHFFEEGFPTEHAKAGNTNVVEWPEALDRTRYEAFIKAIVDKQRGRQGRKKMWVLITLVTREPFRRQGAGGLIVKWGIQQAVKDGCPAYLEAAASAVSLYTSLGFKVVEEIQPKLGDFGGTGEVLLASMAANL